MKKWKPKIKGTWWHISTQGKIVKLEWRNTVLDKADYQYGNCFKTPKDAKIARDKINKLLNTDQ